MIITLDFFILILLILLVVGSFTMVNFFKKENIILHEKMHKMQDKLHVLTENFKK